LAIIEISIFQFLHFGNRKPTCKVKKIAPLMWKS